MSTDKEELNDNTDEIKLPVAQNCAGKIVYEVTVEKGDTYWRLDGKLHRLDGPAVEYAEGTKDWYVNGKRHREDGPAYEDADGSKDWYVNGKRHREDGPAVEYADGDKEWWINGVWYTEEDWQIEVWDNLSETEQERLIFSGFINKEIL